MGKKEDKKLREASDECGKRGFPLALWVRWCILGDDNDSPFVIVDDAVLLIERVGFMFVEYGVDICMHINEGVNGTFLFE